MPIAALRSVGLCFVIAAAAASTGCDSVSKMLEGADKPTASVAGIRFGSLSMDKANLIFDIDIANPYGVPLPLANLDYGLSSGGASFVSGKAAMSGSVPANGSKTVALPVDVVFADVLRAVSGVRPGKVVPYEAAMTLSVDAPGVGPLALPIEKKGELPVPAVPAVSVKSVDFKSLSLDDASAVIQLDVRNTNDFAADLNKLGYALTLSGTQIASGKVAESAKFGAGQTQTLSVPISFKPSGLGLAVFNMLRGEGASYDIAGDMDLGTRFGSVNMPYKKSGSTSFKR